MESLNFQAHISAQTQSGREQIERALPGRSYGRPPLDIPPLPSRALKKIRPQLLVLEYMELWPAWVRACHRAQIPVAIVDGHITQRSLRIRPLLHRAASRLSAFCAQREADAEAARRLGVSPSRIWITGNGKYDGIPLNPPQPSPTLRAAIPPRDLIVGSLHPDEENACLSALASSGLSTLIAPRYPRRSAALLHHAARLGIPARLRSQPGPPTPWIILDTLGELAAAYALGRVVIMGGSFGRRGGQNLIEAAAQGRSVIHGPETENISLEVEALAGHGAWGVKSWSQALERAHTCLQEPYPDPRAALKRLQGATTRQVEVLLRLLTQ